MSLLRRKSRDYTLSCFDPVHQCDRQTDRYLRYDRIATCTVLCVAARGETKLSGHMKISRRNAITGTNPYC